MITLCRVPAVWTITALLCGVNTARSEETPAVETLRLQRGPLTATFRDNSFSPGLLSGIDSLFHREHAPNFDAFDPDQRGASAGLNFEHIISGHHDRHNKFSPRRDRYTLHPLEKGRSVVLVRRAEDSPWNVDSRFSYTVVEPHFIDFEFRCIPRDASRFGSAGYALFFFANYMNDVVNEAIQFRGQSSAGGAEEWITTTAPRSHPDWNRGGNYRSLAASDLTYDRDMLFRLNSWSYDWPRFTQPFYFGRAGRGMTLILMFDRMHSARDEIRFSLYKFKLPKRPRPAWDFQYVIHRVAADETYGFRGRLAWKRFVSPADCLAEYQRWTRGLERREKDRLQSRIQTLRQLGATVFLQRGQVSEVAANRSEINDSQMPLVASFSRMTDLSLEATSIGDAGIVHLRHLQHLEWLNLYRSRVGDAGLQSLRQLRRLQHLPIGETRVTDAGLVYLREMKQLVYLGLRGNPITDGGVRHLSQLTRLEGLHLSETEVTDTGIRSLENMQRLKKLWLDETVVSDRAIDSLVKLRGLRELYIAKTRVTAAGRDRLRRQLPNCRLVETPP